MAAFSFDNADVTVNSVDLSDHVTNVTITAERDELEDSAMGDDWRTFLAGVANWSVTLEFNQDFAASNVDATLWSAFNTGSNITVTILPEGGSVGATNPSYSGSVVPSNYSPFGNSYGELATTSITWKGSGTLTRATS